MSDLVTEFYKNDIHFVIISICQFLTPLVVLPATGNMKRNGNG